MKVHLPSCNINLSNTLEQFPQLRGGQTDLACASLLRSELLSCSPAL
uniref:Uncharacterized protein n=1 Tax=Anguilla anguilla TaxID=7936 RepID=A0A0E9TX30_ANGAN